MNKNLSTLRIDYDGKCDFFCGRKKFQGELEP